MAKWSPIWNMPLTKKQKAAALQAARTTPPSRRKEKGGKLPSRQAAQHAKLQTQTKA